MKLVSVAVEVSPVGTKPPATVDERISKVGRHDLGAASPLSTTTLSLQGRAGGSAFTPKLAELVFGPGSTRRAEKPSGRSIACTAVAGPSVRSRVLVFACPSGSSMARRGCRASYSWLIKCCSKRLIRSLSLSKWLFISPNSSTGAGWPNPNSSSWWTGPLPSETASLSFRSLLGKPQY